jgi:hypothetical protein
MFMAHTAIAADFDDINITKEGDSALFYVGTDSSSGSLTYGVDRKTQICFLSHLGQGGSGAIHGGVGTFQIPCETLKVYPTIKTFIDSGKTP